MNQQSNEYRVPTLDEFVDGFEYEYKEESTYEYGMMDFGKDPVSYVLFDKQHNVKWLKRFHKVYTTPYKIIDAGEGILMMPMPESYYLTQIQAQLDSNLIRVKIKNNEA